jgi:hypothetical protein
LNEAEELLRFAEMWAPFGGPPDVDVFVKFGIVKSMFIERVWQIISSNRCDQKLARRLSMAYTLPTQ